MPSKWRRWIESSNMFRWLSTKEIKIVESLHILTDLQLANLFEQAQPTHEDARAILLECAARFYYSVKTKPKLHV